MIVDQNINNDQNGSTIEDISYMKISSQELIVNDIAGNSFKCRIYFGEKVIRKICESNFIEINQNTIINPSRIKEINTNNRKITLECETKLSVSRRKWHKIKSLKCN